MLSVYVNYPNSRVSAHHDSLCSQIRAQRKRNQRTCKINPLAVAAELDRFRDKEYPFQSKAEWNDMWIEIDLQDREREEAVAREILRLLGTHYKRFAGISMTVHC